MGLIRPLSYTALKGLIRRLRTPKLFWDPLVLLAFPLALPWNSLKLASEKPCLA